MSETLPLLSGKPRPGSQSPVLEAPLTQRQIAKLHWYRQPKLRSIFFIGLVMVSYSVAEITMSLVLKSLVMFSDGLHNLSDGVALAVAFWAEKKKLTAGTEALTFVLFVLFFFFFSFLFFSFLFLSVG
jgi:hypothetical protein